jgi:hypothetical protein
MKPECSNDESGNERALVIRISSFLRHWTFVIRHFLMEQAGQFANCHPSVACNETDRVTGSDGLARIPLYPF